MDTALTDSQFLTYMADANAIKNGRPTRSDFPSASPKVKKQVFGRALAAIDFQDTTNVSTFNRLADLFALVTGRIFDFVNELNALVKLKVDEPQPGRVKFNTAPFFTAFDKGKLLGGPFNLEILKDIFVEILHQAKPQTGSSPELRTYYDDNGVANQLLHLHKSVLADIKLGEDEQQDPLRKAA